MNWAGREAEAEGERRAKIVSAEGEYQAAVQLGQAADIIARHPVALQLRTFPPRVPLFHDATIGDDVRKRSLALELERLDQLQSVFYARALEGDVQSGILCTKIIERRLCAARPLHAAGCHVRGDRGFGTGRDQHRQNP